MTEPSERAVFLDYPVLKPDNSDRDRRVGKIILYCSIFLTLLPVLLDLYVYLTDRNSDGAQFFVSGFLILSITFFVWFPTGLILIFPLFVKETFGGQWWANRISPWQWYRMLTPVFWTIYGLLFILMWITLYSAAEESESRTRSYFNWPRIQPSRPTQ